MDKLRIALFGFDSYVSQIPRYREAFIELGHELNFDKPNIIYMQMILLGMLMQ